MKDTINIIDRLNESSLKTKANKTGIRARLNEISLSRLYSHTKDDNSFAIIGSQDQTTKEDRRKELDDLIRDISSKYPNIGYNTLKGKYTYENGLTGNETSYVIYNIPKEEALRIAKELNQESIIWKDKDFFGFLTQDGTPDGEFDNDEKNMAFGQEDTKAFSSRLPGKHNNSQEFIFK